MRIAILGTRGIPARYGGFETLAEQLAKRLAARGHEVTVYCRRPFTKPTDVLDPGIRRVILPTVSHKYFDTAFHTLISVIHVLFTPTDLVLLCNVANSPLAWIPRVRGIPTVLNVDGLDRKRRKWNSVGRSFLFFCEVMAAATPTRLVTDARLIQQYYRRRYRKQSVTIAYGAEVPVGCDHLEGFELPPKRFILYVSRLEPENNPELVIRAYQHIETDWPLVIVGGNPYDRTFVERLKSLADARVIFVGPIYGDRYWQLLRNAGLYISACEVGGVHPALVEAMAAQNSILYLDTPENRETMGDCGTPFRAGVDDLTAKMTSLIRDPESRAELARRAQQRAQALFSWQEVAQKYEQLFFELRNRKNSTALSDSSLS